MVRLAFLFSFLFILSAHGQEYPPVVATIPSLLVSYGAVATTPTATSTATATATATVSGPTLVQQKTSSGTGTSTTITLDNPYTVGNALIVCISYSNAVVSLSPNSIGSVSTSPNSEDNFAQGPSSQGTSIATDIWYFTNLTASTDTQAIVVIQVGTTRMSINVSEWHGLTDAPPDDQNTNSALASSTVTTNSVTPLTTHNLVIAAGGWVLNDYSSGPTNSFTRMTNIGAGTIWQESAYLLQTSATAKSTGWSLSAGINWAAAIAVFGAP